MVRRAVVEYIGALGDRSPAENGRNGNEIANVGCPDHGAVRRHACDRGCDFVAASLDLPANDAIVLHNSNKLALRLTPCDVFARVAPLGEEVAELEVELAQRLAEVGSPVGSLEPRWTRWCTSGMASR